MSEPIVVSVLGMEIIEWLDHPTSDEWIVVERFNKSAVTALEKKGLLVSTVIEGKRFAKLTTLGRESRFDVIVHFTPEYYQYLDHRNARPRRPAHGVRLKKTKEELSEVPNGDASDNGVSTDDVAGLDNEDSPVVDDHIILSKLTATHGQDCEGNCDDCPHREVLDLIASEYPKVAELLDVLMQKQRLMKELGLKK